MIVSNDSVNAIALPYVWQITDNYGYTRYYLQTNTLSQMAAIHSWPDFDDLPRGNEANVSENEASVARLHEAKDEAEARYYEAEAKTIGLRPCWHRGLNISVLSNNLYCIVHSFLCVRAWYAVAAPSFGASFK